MMATSAELERDTLLARIAGLERKVAQYEGMKTNHGLRDINYRLEKIAELGNDGIMVFTGDYRIEFVNSVAGEITGYQREELLGMDFRRLLSADDMILLNDLHAGVGADESKRLCMEMQIQRKDGLRRDVEICISIAAEGKGLKTYVYIRDITEQKKHGQDLKKSEQRYRRLFERVHHGLFISAREGRFLDCNQALLDMAGYGTKEEFLNIDIARDFYAYPEDRRQFQLLMEEQGYVKDYEVLVKTKQGVTRVVLFTASTQEDEEGRIIGYEGLMIDVTERKRLEREIKNANEFLRNLIESSADGIFVTNMKGDILIFNKGAENILGYRAEEVVGKMNIREIYLPGLAKEVMAKLRGPDYGGPGKIKSFPLFHRSKGGELIEGDLSAALIYNDLGAEIASVGIFRDLRDRLNMERELHHTQQALLQAEKLAAMGRLTSQIAHELNNPIYGIMNTLELLKTEIPPESKRRRILDMALSETQRLSEMLRSMLSFSKPEEEERRRVDLNELVEGILLMMERQMRESNIKVFTYLDRTIPPVLASTNQIRQVLINIFKNGKEGMPKGGTLTVRTALADNRLRVEVADTGMGIPDDIKSRIFDAFFTTKQKVKGVGLGLSVCYGIMKDHGGEILVESAVDKGTNFTLVFPL
ncbi:MAG: PAS domain S-box protein [Smithellaceae bacterium]|nr:PAS domain S-box protein [Smithellaceae bacterium]